MLITNRNLLLCGNAASRGGALAPLTDTFVSATFGTVSGTNMNFADVAVGAADSRLQVLVLVGSSVNTHKHTGVSANAGSIVFTDLAVGMGLTANTANANYVSAWIANVPAGGTLTAPQVQCDVAPSRMVLAVYTHGRGQTLSGTPIKQSTASLAGATTLGGTMDIAAGGACFAISGTSTLGSDATFVGVTESFDVLVGGAYEAAGGMYSNVGGAETPRTINVDWSTDPSNNVRFIAIGFGAKL